MKNLLLVSVIISLLIAVSAFHFHFKTKTSFQPVAVIELFTAQGCFSCPSVHQLLAQTINEAQKDGRKIFALSFDVDYWNRFGWAALFSAKEYSQRQRTYAAQLNDNSVYTPQMIVNVSRQFVGSDKYDLKDALSKSLNTAPAAAFKTRTASVQNNAPLQVKFSLDGNYAGCNINFTLVLLNKTTFNKRYENGNLTLTNENVVRQFIIVPATAAGVINFKLSPVPASNNIAIVAYRQQSSNLKIIGASMA